MWPRWTRMWERVWKGGNTSKGWNKRFLSLKVLLFTSEEKWLQAKVFSSSSFLWVAISMKMNLIKKLLCIESSKRRNDVTTLRRYDERCHETLRHWITNKISFRGCLNEIPCKHFSVPQWKQTQTNKNFTNYTTPKTSQSNVVMQPTFWVPWNLNWLLF